MIVMKKKIWIGAGIFLAGCVLTAGGLSLAAGRGGQEITLQAEEGAWESSEALSGKELEERERERIRETAQAFEIYEEFGMTYDRKQNRFFYNGKMVRHFNDQIGKGSNAFHHN